jgi:hypothetical protein
MRKRGCPKSPVRENRTPESALGGGGWITGRPNAMQAHCKSAVVPLGASGEMDSEVKYGRTAYCVRPKRHDG